MSRWKARAHRKQKSAIVLVPGNVASSPSSPCPGFVGHSPLRASPPRQRSSRADLTQRLRRGRHHRIRVHRPRGYLAFAEAIVASLARGAMRWRKARTVWKTRRETRKAGDARRGIRPERHRPRHCRRHPGDARFATRMRSALCKRRRMSTTSHGRRPEVAPIRKLLWLGRTPRTKWPVVVSLVFKTEARAPTILVHCSERAGGRGLGRRQRPGIRAD